MDQKIKKNEKGEDIVIYDDMEIRLCDWNGPMVDFLHPFVYNQKPFVHDGMTLKEYFIELEYFGQHHKEFLKGTYVPLWKQEEKIAEKIRNEILEKHSFFPQ